MSRWNRQQDTGWAKTNKKIAYEGEQQESQFPSWIEAMKDVFVRCSKKTAIQVFTKYIVPQKEIVMSCLERYLSLIMIIYVRRLNL
jgi:hypothetical protein